MHDKNRLINKHSLNAGNWNFSDLSFLLVELRRTLVLKKFIFNNDFDLRRAFNGNPNAVFIIMTP